MHQLGRCAVLALHEPVGITTTMAAAVHLVPPARSRWELGGFIAWPTEGYNFPCDWVVADDICRGAYPWEGSIAAPGDAVAAPPATREQLVTHLRTHSSELARAQEELEQLQNERTVCILFLTTQLEKIQAAISRIQQRADAAGAGQAVPQCSSFGGHQPHTAVEYQEEQGYCAGLLLLLNDRLASCTQQLAMAQEAFGADDWEAAANLFALTADGDIDEENDQI